MRNNELTKKNNTTFFPFCIFFFKQCVQFSYGFHFTVVSSHWNAEKEKKGKEDWKSGINRTWKKKRIKVLCCVGFMTKWPDIRYLFVVKIGLGWDSFPERNKLLSIFFLFVRLFDWLKNPAFESRYELIKIKGTPVFYWARKVRKFHKLRSFVIISKELTNQNNTIYSLCILWCL